MSYAAYGPVMEEARAKPQIWRLLAGLALAGLTALAISQAALFGALALGGSELIQGALSGTTPGGLLVILYAMGALAIGAFLAARLLHGRGIASVMGPLPLALHQGLRVLVAIAILQAVLLALLMLGSGQELSRNVPMSRWLIFLPFALLGLLIQTGAEEVFFRGYLQSQLAGRFRHPALWLIPQAALFAAGHYAAGTFGSNALGIALWAGAFGLLAGDLTARSGTLGPAIALHFANNAVVILLISMNGVLSGLSLYTFPFSPSDEAAVAAALPLEFASLIVSWLAARLALRV